MTIGTDGVDSVGRATLTEQVKQLLWHTLSTARFDGVDIIREQVSVIVAVRGPTTLLEIEVAPHCPKIRRADGTLPVMPSITDSSGTPVGELLIWIEDGHLSALEYAWWSDEPPTHLPQVGQLQSD